VATSFQFEGLMFYVLAMNLEKILVESRKRKITK
jgi:hypothetical protein